MKKYMTHFTPSHPGSSEKYTSLAAALAANPVMITMFDGTVHLVFRASYTEEG